MASILNFQKILWRKFSTLGDVMLKKWCCPTHAKLLNCLCTMHIQPNSPIFVEEYSHSLKSGKLSIWKIDWNLKNKNLENPESSTRLIPIIRPIPRFTALGTQQKLPQLNWASYWIKPPSGSQKTIWCSTRRSVLRCFLHPKGSGSAEKSRSLSEERV